MFITKMSLPRRTFLKGAGVTLALPLLDAMVPAMSALSKTAARPICRAGFIYIPNGAVIDKVSHGVDAWSPIGEGAGFEYSPILKPLEGVRDHLIVLSGLNQSVATPVGDWPGDHARATSTWLSGVRIKKTEGIDVRAGVTIDRRRDEHVGRDKTLPWLELAMDTKERIGN
jgi:hypothetical protein